MASDDLGPLLEDWPYDPDDTARIVRGTDGRKKLQVRLPLGIEQYELDGRPDGRAPGGFGSLLAYYEDQLRRHREKNGGDDGFSLSAEACEDLRAESLLFYYRYVVLFQVGEYGRTARDTGRNLRVLNMLRRYAEQEVHRESLEPYRPYIVRMHQASRALLATTRDKFDIALAEIERGIRAIEVMRAGEKADVQYEKQRSLEFLRELGDEIRAQRPLTLGERLTRRLEKAVREENYELAADLRDRIAALGDRAD